MELVKDILLFAGAWLGASVLMFILFRVWVRMFQYCSTDLTEYVMWTAIVVFPPLVALVLPGALVYGIFKVIDDLMDTVVDLPANREAKKELARRAKAKELLKKSMATTYGE